LPPRGDTGDLPPLGGGGRKGIHNRPIEREKPASLVEGRGKKGRKLKVLCIDFMIFHKRVLLLRRVYLILSAKKREEIFGVECGERSLR